MNKKYLNISEVSKLLDLKEHVIRYWDSISPNTNSLRFEGLSTKSRAGTRYFNRENILKLKRLKKLIYNKGASNYSTLLAKEILSSNNSSKKEHFNISNDTKSSFLNNAKNDEKITQILKNMRLLLK